jgi:tetratricopeptide (TPR) repeat protein
MPELQAIVSYNRLALRVSRDGGKEQALLLLANALRLAREIGRPMLESWSKHNMGLIFLQAGQEAEAAVCFRIALSLADRRGRPGRGLRGRIEQDLRRCTGSA